MKWPWVSRRAFDLRGELVDRLVGQEQLLREQLDKAVAKVLYEAREADFRRAQQENTELVSELLRMKRAGYEPTPKEPDPEPPIALPPEVEAAIEERAVDTASRRLLTRYAMTELRREEATAESVAAKVLVGEDVDELMP